MTAPLRDLWTQRHPLKTPIKTFLPGDRIKQGAATDAGLYVPTGKGWVIFAKLIMIIHCLQSNNSLHSWDGQRKPISTWDISQTKKKNMFSVSGFIIWHLEALAYLSQSLTSCSDNWLSVHKTFWEKQFLKTCSDCITYLKSYSNYWE